MGGSCRKSCSLCDEDDDVTEPSELQTPDECANTADDVDCAAWASDGWCVGDVKQVEHMRKKCARFCNFCKRGAAWEKFT